MTATPVLVGTYGPDAGGRGRGVYRVEDVADPATPVGPVIATASPSFLCAAGGGRIAAVTEGAGDLELWSCDGRGSRLLARRPTGDGPCHVAVAGDDLVVSCYGDGRVAVVPLEPDGLGTARILAPPAPAPAPGREPNRGGPHAHSALLTPDALLVADLGLDAIRVLEPGGTDGRRETGVLDTGSGTGPRHLAAHPSGTVLVDTELSGEVLVVRVGEGVLSRTALPSEGFPSEIALAADGTLAYVAVRGADVIEVLEVVEGGRRVVPRATVPAGGRTPRHLVVLPGLLVVAAQDSDELAVHELDRDGVPRLRHRIAVPSPACILPVGERLPVGPG